MTKNQIPRTDGAVKTIRDVASLAGVSTATVSRVVNGTAQVSPETRDKVLKAVSVSQYRRNEMAAQLAQFNCGHPRKRGRTACRTGPS